MAFNKPAFYEACLRFIKARIETAETALAQAQEASNDDTKSSAGDKFETTREMMQLADAQQNMALLKTLVDVPAAAAVKNGSLVETSQGVFYVSISAGQLSVEGKPAFAISAASPVGQLMLGKQVGETFTFNQKAYEIVSIQ